MLNLSLATPIDSNGKNRRELARCVEHAIADALSSPRSPQDTWNTFRSSKRIAVRVPPHRQPVSKRDEIVP